MYAPCCSKLTSMKNKLRQSLSDVLAFEDDQARSKSGRIALEIPNNNEVRLFLTLPEPKDPSIFLLMGVLTAFVATTAPELPDPETLIKTSCAELGKGRIASIIK